MGIYNSRETTTDLSWCVLQVRVGKVQIILSEKKKKDSRVKNKNNQKVEIRAARYIVSAIVT